jgi:hypothetical protein
MEKTSKKSNKVVKTTTKKNKTIMDSVNETAKEIQAEVVETANEGRSNRNKPKLERFGNDRRERSSRNARH